MAKIIATIIVGFLSAYNQTPTDATIAIRQEWGHIPDSLEQYDGVIAVQDCSLIGKSATLIVEDDLFNVIIFDCAGRTDGGKEWMEENRIAAEIGWYLWQENPDIVGKEARIIVGTQKARKKTTEIAARIIEPHLVLKEIDNEDFYAKTQEVRSRRSLS